MTLAEKIFALRGEQKLSQGDLAEKLDVSRQSVSKWETGQAVPELDKIIKLADLFGVSVDELVRETETPKPEAVPPMAAPETKIVYVERRFTPVQTLGIILIVGGLVMVLLTMVSATFLFIGGALAILGLPLLLAKKHPFLIDGWLLWAAGFFLLCNPAITGNMWNPLQGFVVWWQQMSADEAEGFRHPAIILMALAYLGVSLLTLALPSYTGWLCWKRWKIGRGLKAETDA